MVLSRTDVSFFSTMAIALSSLTAGIVLGRSLPAASPAAAVSDTIIERLYIQVSFDVKPERVEEFLSEIRKNEVATLGGEPLARGYQWGEDIETPNRYHFHEEYVGQEGFQAHLDSEHIKSWDAFVASDPFSSEVVGPFKYYAASPAPTTYPGRIQNRA